MKIENFKLKDFLLQPKKVVDEYVTALQYMGAIETKRQVFDLKLKHVEFIKKNIDNQDDSGLVKIIARVQKISVADVLEMKIIKFFGLLKSVREQLEVIANAEVNSLTPEYKDWKWESVGGGEKMAKFGIYNTLDALTGERIWLNKKILNLPYSEIFATMYKRRVAADLQKEMDAIKTKKKK